MLTISYQNIKDSKQFGGNVLANACGPCIGQWDRKDVKKGKKKKTLSLLTIAISQLVTMPFHVFVTISPELTTTLALAGSLAHWSRLVNLVSVYTLFNKLVNIERS